MINDDDEDDDDGWIRVMLMNNHPIFPLFFLSLISSDNKLSVKMRK